MPKHPPVYSPTAIQEMELRLRELVAILNSHYYSCDNCNDSTCHGDRHCDCLEKSAGKAEAFLNSLL